MPKWQGSDRRARLPRDWPTRRVRILIRDGYRCQHIREDTGLRCLAPARDVDHKIPNDDHGDHNLESLCGWHHDQKSGREGGIASGVARRRARDEAKPKHPGLR